MRNTRTLIITEVALAIALAAALNALQIRLPFNVAGGSVNLSMLPIALVALRRGVIPGMIAGTVFGCFDLLIEPFILVPVQVLLDYPVPYMLFGFGVGCFSGLYNKYASKDAVQHTGRFIAMSTVIVLAALVAGGLLRLFVHSLSGVVFFAEYAIGFFEENPALMLAGPADTGLNVWIYSVLYNLTYIVPSLISVGVLLLVIAPVLARAVPVKKLVPVKRQNEVLTS